MNILFVYQFCSLGGVETCLRNRLKGVEKEDKVDILFFNNYGGTELFDDIHCRIHFIQDKDKIIEFIETNKYDLLVSIDTPHILEILKEAQFNGKVILECHTTYEASLTYLGELELENLSCIVVPSEFQKRIVKRMLKHNTDIVVVPNTVDKNKFYPIEQMEIKKPILGWVGRLDEHKNWKMFIKIIKACVDNDIDITGYVIGGKGSGDEAINELKELIIRYKIGAYITWLPYIENGNMADIYSKIGQSNGCMINTSKCESFGMTIVEAMACRCLTIANDFEVAYEIIEHEKTGLVIEMEEYNMEEILEGIRKIINDSITREKMIEAGYKECSQKYDAEIAWSKYIDKIKGYL